MVKKGGCFHGGMTLEAKDLLMLYLEMWYSERLLELTIIIIVSYEVNRHLLKWLMITNGAYRMYSQTN